MYYGKVFLPPRELGRKNADRFQKELILDNLGMCRFHRGWAEEMIPEIMESLYGLKEKFLKKSPSLLVVLIAEILLFFGNLKEISNSSTLF